MLGQACLCAGNDRESSFHLCRGSVKHVKACLYAGKEREISFHPC